MSLATLPYAHLMGLGRATVDRMKQAIKRKPHKAAAKPAQQPRQAAAPGPSFGQLVTGTAPTLASSSPTKPAPFFRSTLEAARRQAVQSENQRMRAICWHAVKVGHDSPALMRVAQALAFETCMEAPAAIAVLDDVAQEMSQQGRRFPWSAAAHAAPPAAPAMREPETIEDLAELAQAEARRKRATY